MIYGEDMHPLRDYQIKAISDIRAEFKKGRRKILLVAPTGSGKTVIASEIIKRAEENGKKTLFVAHRRQLIMQASRKLRDFSVNHGVLMAGKSPNDFANVQVASVQTFTSRKDRDDFTKPEADLVILDEAHRSVSDSFKLLIEEYPEAFFLGLTATPIRNDGRGLGDIYEKIVECGSIKELTKMGYLVPSRVVAPSLPDLKGIRIVAGDYEKKTLEKRMNVPKLVGDLVDHWVKHANDRSTIIFCTSIAHSKYVSSIFNQNGIRAGHIDGEMPELEREKQLKDLKEGRIQILANCQVLTEGYDEPRVSCVVLARPTKSYSMFLQTVGRSLRPFEGKKDTLIIDHAGAVYEHGFPDDPPTWKLELTKNDYRKPNKALPIEKQPFTCISCKTVYQPSKNAPECPMCLHVPTKREKMVLIKQGRLIEVKPDVVTAEDKRNFYGQVLYYAIQKGYQRGWASWIFKNKFNHFPQNKKVSPIHPSKKVLKYIQHYNIKQARGREKYE